MPRGSFSGVLSRSITSHRFFKLWYSDSSMLSHAVFAGRCQCWQSSSNPLIGVRFIPPAKPPNRRPRFFFSGIKKRKNWACDVGNHWLSGCITRDTPMGLKRTTARFGRKLRTRRVVTYSPKDMREINPFLENATLAK